MWRLCRASTPVDSLSQAGEKPPKIASFGGFSSLICQIWSRWAWDGFSLVFFSLGRDESLYFLNHNYCTWLIPGYCSLYVFGFDEGCFFNLRFMGGTAPQEWRLDRASTINILTVSKKFIYCLLSVEPPLLWIAFPMLREVPFPQQCSHWKLCRLNLFGNNIWCRFEMTSTACYWWSVVRRTLCNLR